MTDEMTRAELRTADPREFEKRYWKWRESQCDYSWWDYTYEYFAETLKDEGFEMDLMRTGFSLSYSQGDHASIAGTLDLATWLRNAGYEATHLALILDTEDYRAQIVFTPMHRAATAISLHYAPGNCSPSGVFKDLPQAAWDALVCEQWDSRDWYAELREWIRTKDRELYEALVTEYEYLTSEEMFIECEGAQP